MRRIVSKPILWSLLLALYPLYASGQQYPCPDGPTVSNVEMRECYTKAQALMNKKAEKIAARIAENLRTISPEDKTLDGPVVVKLLKDAAQKIDTSQTHWKAYRDDYCNAITLSYTTGSGAGRAYEECLYRTAVARVHQLLDDFPNAAVVRAHRH
jgi:uncharacterized protein YecT (DUF1311 family)